MKKLFLLALIPFVAGCDLIGQLIPLPNDKPHTINVETISPSFQYRAVNDNTWTTVAAIALTGEVSTRDRNTGKVINTSTINAASNSAMIATSAGEQDVFVSLRANNLIAEGNQRLQVPTSLNIKVTLYPLLSRVVIPPVSVGVGTTKVEYWVLGPLFRVVPNISFYTTSVKILSGMATVGTVDEAGFSLNVPQAASGQDLEIELTVKGAGTQQLTSITTTTKIVVQ
jgi:hypothetical protein